MSSYRLAARGIIDRRRPLTFKFDGKPFTGFFGDTLASALLANGISTVARSFKYHRRRGIFSAGPEEPNALLTLGEHAYSEPNTSAPMIELYEGLVASSQNRWPSLGFDVLSMNRLAKPILGAGFYYKTFMGPTRHAWPFFERFIRRAAGMGTAPDLPDPDRYETMHAFADVLVVGAGPAGLMAALTAARSGAKTVLIDENPRFGGSLVGDSQAIGDEPAHAWTEGVVRALRKLSSISLLTRTTGYGFFGEHTLAAVERVSDHLNSPGALPRQRHWKIRARRIILAAGSIERPIVFDNNDLPGIMLSDAMRAYVNRFAVAPGRDVAFFVNNDGAYRSVLDLSSAGVRIACVVDVRKSVDQELVRIVEKSDARLLTGCTILRADGRRRIRSITVASHDSESQRWSGNACRFQIDSLGVSGGWTPTVHLSSQIGGRTSWSERLAAFLPAPPVNSFTVAGAMAGHFDTESCLLDGLTVASRIVQELGFEPARVTVPRVERTPVADRVAPVWEARPNHTNAFVDLQHDVTSSDIRLAHIEGFRSPEHLKRYTTLGMATDQGKTSNLNGLALLAGIDGKPLSEMSPTRYRLPYTPVSIGALAGSLRGAHFRPVRRSPINDWHVAHGAVMASAGLWLRPRAYVRKSESFEAACLREAKHVRDSVGVVDVSTLGKIDVQGPDAPEFLNRLYVNNLLSLPVGKARYGLMLREDGLVLDDGTSWRLDDHRYLMTTTTANASMVLAHLEFLLASAWPTLRVAVTSLTDQWFGLTIAGPNSRAVLESIVDDLDLCNSAFPPMAVGYATISGIPVVICRVSFSGELSFEVYCGSSLGTSLWEALLRAGRPWNIAPYGTEALGTLRIEKGHPSSSEMDGRTSPDDLGLGRLVSREKSFVGSALLDRPGLTDSDRPKLVGLVSLDQKPIRSGSQIVEHSSRSGVQPSLGHVSSSTYSPTLGKYIALALVSRGHQRMGDQAYAAFPLKKKTVSVEIVDRCSLTRQEVACMAEPCSSSSRELPGTTRYPFTEAGPVFVHHRSLPGLIQVCAWPETIEEVRSFIYSAIGVMPSTDPGVSSSLDSAVVMNLAPGRFLIEPPDTTQEAGVLRQTLGRIGTLTELGHSRTCIRLSGAGVTWSLSKGVSLDLHLSTFPRGRVVQTAVHHMPVIIHRIDGDIFDMYVYRSFAAFACDWLQVIRQ